MFYTYTVICDTYLSAIIFPLLLHLGPWKDKRINVINSKCAQGYEDILAESSYCYKFETADAKEKAKYPEAKDQCGKNKSLVTFETSDMLHYIMHRSLQKGQETAWVGYERKSGDLLLNI